MIFSLIITSQRDGSQVLFFFFNFIWEFLKTCHDDTEPPKWQCSKESDPTSRLRVSLAWEGDISATFSV